MVRKLTDDELKAEIIEFLCKAIQSVHKCESIDVSKWSFDDKDFTSFSMNLELSYRSPKKKKAVNE